MKRKSFVLGFSYLFGMLCAFLLNDMFPAALISVTAVTAAVVLSLIKRSDAALGFFAFAIASGVFAIYSTLEIAPLRTLAGQTMELTGVITEKGEPDNDNSSYIVCADIEGKNAVISLYAPDINADYGDTVRFTAKLSEFTDNTNFAEKSYYFSKGIFLKAAIVGEMEIISADDSGIIGAIYDYSDYIRSRTLFYLGDTEGELITAFFFGDKSRLSGDMKSAVRRSGVSHFASVSGMHLTLIISTMLIMLGLTPLRNCHRLKFLLTVVVILGFMIFFKLSVSVIRSGVMLMIFYAGDALHRRTDTLNSVGFALLVILIFSPTAFADTGLLLSVAGTIGIGCVAPAVSKGLKIKSKWLNALVGMTCASAATLPLSAFFFGGFSVAGILTNLLITPFFTAVLVLMLIITATGGVLCEPVLLAAGLLTKPIVMFIDIIGGFKYSYIPLNDDFSAVLIILTLIFTASATLIFRKTQYTVGAAAISVCTFCLIYTINAYLTADDTTVKIYSDGNDCCVMINDGGTLAAISSNDSEKIKNAAAEFMHDSFSDRYSLMYFCGSGENNISSFEEIADSTSVIMKTEKECVFRLGERITVEACTDYTVVRVGGVCITVAKSGADVPVSNIAVLYGYKKKQPPITADCTIYSDRKMLFDNTVNAFFTQTEINIKNGKMAF